MKAKDEEIFAAIKCKSWNAFKNGNCDDEAPIAFMGFDCPLTAHGDYYLQTSKHEPFSKGRAGLVF